MSTKHNDELKRTCWHLHTFFLHTGGPGGGGTPSQYLYGYVPPNGSGDFGTPDLKRGIHICRFYRKACNIANARKLQDISSVLNYL